MKFSYNWLKELTGSKLSPEKMANELMMHSFEVESIEKSGTNVEHIVVGKITDIKKHPGADKLHITKIDLKNNLLTIVCGADNIKIGDKVPVALSGAKLANGMEIEEAIIRGIKSEGMLLSEKELGLGADHLGIFILESNAKVGLPFKKYAGFDDYVLDIKILADRAHDCLNYVGISREISAIENRKLPYDYEGLKLKAKKSAKLKIVIKEKRLCSRYIGAVIENVEILDSPLWLKSRLIASGIKPINNVVDVTNYVMLGLGQPLHAFDHSSIAGGQIVVRNAKRGEKISLLDGKVIGLSKENLLIADMQKNLAVAGVMGNQGSGITSKTQAIVIESANFNAGSIRKTRMHLGIRTDASERFEKDLDPNIAEKAIVRAIEIIEKISQGKLEGVAEVYSKKVLPRKLGLMMDDIENLLGERIPAKKILSILKFLGTNPSIKTGRISLIIPTFRIDLKTQEDVIEEIGRIYGYEKIKSIAPMEEIAAPKRNVSRSTERMIKNILSGCGFDEVYNYSFYSEKDARRTALFDMKHYELENPMNPEQQYLRISLIPGILKNISENLKNFAEIGIFEIGRVYLPHAQLKDKKSRSEAGILPDERARLAIAIVLDQDKGSETFFELKGLISNFLQRVIGIDSNIKFIKSNDSIIKLWHPVRYADIRINNKDNIGTIGEISPFVLSAHKITKRVAMAEFYLDAFTGISVTDKNYKSIRKYPIISRDISLMLEEKATISEILDTIQKIGGRLVVNSELFDIFDKNGKTSLAFHINFGSGERTLENREVDALMHKIIYALESDLNCKVRK